LGPLNCWKRKKRITLTGKTAAPSRTDANERKNKKNGLPLSKTWKNLTPTSWEGRKLGVQEGWPRFLTDEESAQPPKEKRRKKRKRQTAGTEKPQNCIPRIQKRKKGDEKLGGARVKRLLRNGNQAGRGEKKNHAISDSSAQKKR